MNFAIILLVLTYLQPCICQSCSPAYSRLPLNSDMEVTCRTTDIQLSINVCPVYFANFFPGDLALNGRHNQTECLGLLDNSKDPVVLKFTMQLDGSSSNICGNIIEITNNVGTGYFSQYSNVQAVRISGFVDTTPLAEMGVVSYSTNLYYNFSCLYPLQYLINNTQLFTSFGAVAVNNNNGSFLSTLRMQIFMDATFSTELSTNGTVAYDVKKKIYVQVTSNNTATSYFVYLDQCFATPSPLVTSGANDSYSFFTTGCSVQNRTSIILNGQGPSAQFSFDAFRFMQHNGQKTSSIYLHCMTRLCLSDQCPRCPNSRKKRDTNAVKEDSKPVMVSSGPINMLEETRQESGVSSGGTSQLRDNLLGLTVGLITGTILRM